jgi:hypothetical protein
MEEGHGPKDCGETMSEETIYSSVVHTELDLKQWEEQTYCLKKVLYNQPNHTYIHAKELAKLSGFPTNGTQIQMRQAISWLIEKQGCPIVSNHMGYSWADNPREMQMCIDQLNERLNGIMRRRDALVQIMNGMVNNER